MLPDGALLEAREINCWRGERHILRDVSFSMRAGEFLKLTGPNGVGKTSLLRALARNSIRLLENGRRDAVATNLQLMDDMVERMSQITRQLKSFARKADEPAGGSTPLLERVSLSFK